MQVAVAASAGTTDPPVRRHAVLDVREASDNPRTMQNIEVVAAVVFALALLHTFAAKFFEHLAHRHPRHAGLLHLLGEVEGCSASGPSCWWRQSA